MDRSLSSPFPISAVRSTTRPPTRLVRAYLPGGAGTRSMCSADGTRLMCAMGTHSIVVWEVATGKELFKTEWALAGSAAISGDGKRVASGSAGFAWLYDVESGQKLCRMNLPALADVTAAALNHDGSQVAFGSSDWKVRVFDLPAKFEAVADLEASAELVAHASPVRSVVFSPKGDRLVSGSDDGCIKVWDPHARLEALGLRLAHGVAVQRLLFSPDGTRLIAIGQKNGATIFDGTAGP